MEPRVVLAKLHISHGIGEDVTERIAVRIHDQWYLTNPGTKIQTFTLEPGMYEVRAFDSLDKVQDWLENRK